MQRAVIGSLLWALGMLSGCGGPAPESKITAAPHGGNIVELSDGAGYVELKTTRVAPVKGSSKVMKSRIEAYFYQPDGTASMSPPPTDVKLTLGAEASGNVVNLSPEASEPGKFASEPGDFVDELRGQIDLQVGGKAANAKFSFR
jgi:hypothetical protein